MKGLLLQCKLLRQKSFLKILIEKRKRNVANRFISFLIFKTKMNLN